MTAPVRYTITDELWESFTVEQVNKQIARLRETGRFRLPNNGGPFTVRLSYYAAVGDPEWFFVRDDLNAENGIVPPRNSSERQGFYDFHFGDDGDENWVTVVFRTRIPGSLNWTPERRRAYEHRVYDTQAEVERRFGTVRLPHEIVKSLWWERDFECHRVRTRCLPS